MVKYLRAHGLDICDGSCRPRRDASRRRAPPCIGTSWLWLTGNWLRNAAFGWLFTCFLSLFFSAEKYRCDVCVCLLVFFFALCFVRPNGLKFKSRVAVDNHRWKHRCSDVINIFKNIDVSWRLSMYLAHH